ncbi:PREDICTED: putative carbonic anhydrase 3 isoform X2 [Dinoponera quadriceps]|uniref:Carbonic anhydrase 3 isoform X2 n=1 Tax=Dinoponera quadriceps TaxID=609295 RepID=A0A6P3Y4M2_DINQU|nr:PREDICTED: putative carbonic anhydrase 3 isoform X2 [Dinoponera quadriceps]
MTLCAPRVKFDLGRLLVVTLTLLCTGLHVSKANDWGYWSENGPDNWPGLCTAGKKQSPIDIVTEDTVRFDLGALKFDRYDFAFSGMVINTGHSVQITLDGVPIHLSGGSLPSIYVLEQMHFHWSAEHTVDGFRHPLELHFVHYDVQYANFSVAAEHENGIVVVAVLFELSNEDNQDLAAILKATELVSQWVGKNMVHIRKKLIPYLLLPKDHTTYYRYQGSLTTPGCQESVMWFIMTEKLTVSETQVNVFKRVMSGDHALKSNYRPTQDLGDRKVYHRLEGYSGTSSFSSSIISNILSIVLVRLLQLSDDF